MRKSSSFYFFKRKPLPPPNRYEDWRGVADLLELKPHERLRLEWIIFYYAIAKENASLTSHHFGISRKTFYKWFNCFKESRWDVESFRDESRRPHKVRSWEVTLQQEERIKRLRRRYMYYGKNKLKVLYRKGYNEEISTWKIERVIREYKLYPDKIKQAKTARKQARARQNPKRRIQQLKKEEKLWFLLQLDTIVIYWGKVKRYIITAVDHASKLGYARMYKTKSSKAAADFLHRLQYLVQQRIENTQMDNGSEFAHLFVKAADRLGINRFYSRVRTPKDNPEVERFNETLEYEWLYNGNLTTNCSELNQGLTNWLIEYNFNRPHETLDYLTPIEYIEKHLEKDRGSAKVLPMYSARTRG